MSELIDREALLDECINHYEVGNIEQNCTMDWICKTVRNFPTAYPWHRVEEDLPNEFDTVIVYGRMKYDHEKDYEVFVDAAEYGPYNYSHDRWVTWNDWYEGQEEFKITHWMPLPEPPKEEEHGN